MAVPLGRLPRRSSVAAGALFTAALALSACGNAGVDDHAAARGRLSSSGAAPGGEEVEVDGEGGEVVLEDVVPMAGTQIDVTARDNTFDIENIKVESGATIVWTNQGRQDHNIIPVEDGGWGVDTAGFQPDAIYEHTFDEPGTYQYYCSLHGTETAGMVGAVVVE